MQNDIVESHLNSLWPTDAIYVSFNDHDHHWFRWWLGICSAPSHHLNQCWLNPQEPTSAICKNKDVFFMKILSAKGWLFFGGPKCVNIVQCNTMVHARAPKRWTLNCKLTKDIPYISITGMGELYMGRLFVCIPRKPTMLLWRHCDTILALQDDTIAVENIQYQETRHSNIVCEFHDSI